MSLKHLTRPFLENSDVEEVLDPEPSILNQDGSKWIDFSHPSAVGQCKGKLRVQVGAPRIGILSERSLEKEKKKRNSAFLRGWSSGRAAPHPRRLLRYESAASCARVGIHHASRVFESKASCYGTIHVLWF
jgi:hypothetical protein